MGIYRRGYKILIGVFIILSIFSCKTKYKVTSTSSRETVERIVTQVNPYLHESTAKIEVIDGVLQPIILKVVGEDNVEATAEINNKGELNLALKRIDTLTTTIVETVVKTTNNKVTKVERSTWSKFKTRIFWISVLINVIVIGGFLVKMYLKLKPI